MGGWQWDSDEAYIVFTLRGIRDGMANPSNPAEPAAAAEVTEDEKQEARVLFRDSLRRMVPGEAVFVPPRPLRQLDLPLKMRH